MTIIMHLISCYVKLNFHFSDLRSLCHAVTFLSLSNCIVTNLYFFVGKSYICLAIIDLVSDTLFDDDYQCVDVNDGAVVLDCARGMQLKHIEHIYEFQDL